MSEQLTGGCPRWSHFVEIISNAEDSLCPAPRDEPGDDVLLHLLGLF